MTTTRDLDPATLMAYAAGALDESLALVVASHLDWRPEAAARLRRAEAFGGALLEDQAPEPLGEDTRAKALAAIAGDVAARPAPTAPMIEDDDLPRPLRRVLPAPLDALPFRRISKGVGLYNVKLSPQATGSLRIWRLAPGQETPEHGHGGTEITMVLRGSLTDAFGTFRRGDVEDLGDDVEHQPVAGEGEDCICMIGSEKPTRFKRLLPRLLQPIFRF
jgi:putative transcriptional regulator